MSRGMRIMGMPNDARRDASHRKHGRYYDEETWPQTLKNKRQRRNHGSINHDVSFIGVLTWAVSSTFLLSGTLPRLRLSGNHQDIEKTRGWELRGEFLRAGVKSQFIQGRHNIGWGRMRSARQHIVAAHSGSSKSGAVSLSNHIYTQHGRLRRFGCGISSHVFFFFSQLYLVPSSLIPALHFSFPDRT